MPDLSAMCLTKWQSVDRKLNWEAFISCNLLRGSHASQYSCHVYKHITSFWVNFPQCTINSKWMVYLKGARTNSPPWKMTGGCRDSRSSRYNYSKTGCFNLHILFPRKIQCWKEPSSPGNLLGTLFYCSPPTFSSPLKSGDYYINHLQ